MTISEPMKRFIIRWGEMGTRWGINRTIAQIHGLLFISEYPLNAEDITMILDVARSNVSTGLKELMNWGLVKSVHKAGDRRDHFEAIKDIWEVSTLILDQRKKQEIDPTINLLKECLSEYETKTSRSENLYTKKKLKEMLSFFETMAGWYSQVRKMPVAKVLNFINLGKHFKGFK